MKLVLPACLLSVAIGAVIGVVLERRRTPLPAEPPAPASQAAPADAPRAEVTLETGDLADDLRRAKERIRSLKAQLAELKGETEEEADEESLKKRAKELRARIGELVEKGDGAGLLSLMKELAALGEPGFKGAMEIAEIFRKEFKDGDEAFGLAKVQFNKAFGGAMATLMDWALDHPESASAWFRLHSAHMLFWVSDVDAGPIFLDALAREKDPNVAAAMAGYLERLAKPEMVTSLAGAAREHAGKPQTLKPILEALINVGTSASEQALRDLARDANPALRAEAELALIAHSPPAPGVLITWTSPKSQAETVGLLRGDIIVSYDGKAVASLDQLRKQVQAKPDNDLVTVMVNRSGTLVPVQIKGQRIGIDGRQVTPR